MYIYIYISLRGRQREAAWRGVDLYSLWRRGVAFHVLDVSHETPEVSPCGTSPRCRLFVHLWREMPDVTHMSHLTAADCNDSNNDITNSNTNTNTNTNTNNNNNHDNKYYYYY